MGPRTLKQAVRLSTRVFPIYLIAIPTQTFSTFAKSSGCSSIERFIAQDVYNRLILDVGKAVQEKASGFSAALLRMRQIKDYIRETISASFRAMRAIASALTPRSVAQMATRAFAEAFAVFEDYIQ